MSRLAVNFLGFCAAAYAVNSSPTARVRNGTYVGVRSTTYEQDFFLGMPYAQQPLGTLRFAVPQSLIENWDGARDAKEYSDICIGYGVTTAFFFKGSERLLTYTIPDGLDLVSSVRSMPNTECHPQLMR